MKHSELKQLTEAYGLGALDDAESRAYEAHLQAGCPECEKLLHDMQQAVALLPYSAREEPPPAALKERIMASVRPEPLPGTAHPLKHFGDKVQERVIRWRRRTWVLAAACVFLFVVSAAYVTQLRKEIDFLRGSLRESQVLVQELRSEVSEKRNRMLAVLSPGVQIIELSGQTPAPASNARVFLDPAKRDGWMYAFDLPDPPDDKDYQLWMLRGSEAVDAGVFARSNDGLWQAYFKATSDVSNVTAFAVTLEPGGGVPQPTGPMYLLGTVSGS